MPDTVALASSWTFRAWAEESWALCRISSESSRGGGLKLPQLVWLKVRLKATIYWCSKR